MLAELSKKFLIIGLSRFSRDFARACLTCKRLNPIPLAQQMGPLPADLASARYTRAFSVIGVDFAGPFHPKGADRGLRVPQRYVLLITCMHTRGVHF